MESPAPTVLIVDDFAAVRVALRALVLRGRERARVLEADGIRAALGAAATNRLDLAIVDVHLADGDGIELVGRLRAAHPELPCAVVTFDATAWNEARALDAGACAFVTKERLGQALGPLLERWLASERR